MTLTIESVVFIGNNYQNCHSIVNTTDLTLKWSTSTRLVSEQNEISGLETISWENHSWKYVSFIGDERIMNLHAVEYFRRFHNVAALR